MVIGKIIGGCLGLLSGGFFGAIIGLIIGHFFDKTVSQATRVDFGADRLKRQRVFFETTFSIMGHLAKADGRVSEQEIAQAEAIMARSGLIGEHRQQAIDYFKQGVNPNFQLEETVARFIHEGGRTRNLSILLLEFLVSMALADEYLHPAQQQILTETAKYLGFTQRQFQQLLAMFMAQRGFSRRQYSYQGYQQHSETIQHSQLAKAYKALGVNSTVGDRDLKRAYRRLMGQHHPDKLAAKGVPEEMLKMATEKSQEIQAAYELIKHSRKR